MTPAKTVFEFEQSGDTLILIPHGPFMEFRDHDIRNAYNEAFRRLTEPGARNLLVDFSKLDYFGSTFVGVLMRLSGKVHSNGGKTALCCLSESMKDMLKTLMLLENKKVEFTLTPFETREAALKSMASA